MEMINDAKFTYEQAMDDESEQLKRKHARAKKKWSKVATVVKIGLGANQGKKKDRCFGCLVRRHRYEPALFPATADESVEVKP